VEIILGIFGYDSLEIRNCSGEILQLDFRNRAAVKRIGRIGARGNRFVIALAGAGEFPLF